MSNDSCGEIRVGMRLLDETLDQSNSTLSESNSYDEYKMSRQNDAFETSQTRAGTFNTSLDRNSFSVSTFKTADDHTRSRSNVVLLKNKD